MQEERVQIWLIKEQMNHSIHVNAQETTTGTLHLVFNKSNVIYHLVQYKPLTGPHTETDH